ncbi:hypothetical protein [Corynebacterium glyciniphilum]|uniref:hypothetical protein n=1 Tax=Corynebacterium glyciniphilum TaxID=1404244 RepID=UPI00264B9777|nr:hypothetical protein [Corynebacterium glyciniphilum]MDN6706375.1 hypothetical protein [Corynebacterium glyciniphilum]
MANNSKKKNTKKKTGPVNEQQDDNLFHYKFKGLGITLPKFGDWTFAVRRQLLVTPKMDDQITIALAGSADEHSLEVIDMMHDDEVADLVTAWMRNAGISLGESSGSGES